MGTAAVGQNFGLPKLFTSFTTAKATSDNETIVSPKFILDGKPFSTLRNSFWSDPNNNSPRALGIANVLQDEESVECSAKPLLFGSKLKIQISTLANTTFETPSPRSLSDFGIKTKISNTLGNSLAIPSTVPNGKVFNGFLSPREMEISEDYTCVISHGPNPKTTHIYTDCILENCCNALVEFSSSISSETRFLHPTGHQKQSFLSFCDSCNKSLKENDIYIYRGEKAFCSYECRLQEILTEESRKKLKS